MRQKALLVLFALAVVGMSFVAAQAVDNPATYLNPLNTLYGQGYNCNVCHTTNAGPTRNPYGTAFQNAAGATVQLRLQAIEGLDSDGDTFTNLQELQAGSLPGDPSSTPGAPPPGPVDLTSYENQWFQLKLLRSGKTAGTGNLGNDRGPQQAFLQTGAFTDPNPGVSGDEFFLGSTLFVLNPGTGLWETWAAGDLHVTPGNPLQFLVWMRGDTTPSADTGDGFQAGFTAQVTAKEARGGGLGLVKFKSLGGYFVDVTPGGTHRTGGIKLSGKMVPAANVPSPPR